MACLNEKCGIKPNTRVVVGVSGGADSLCLLLALHQLGVPLIAVHFDHRLRETSSQDEIEVRGIAARLGVEYTHGSKPVTDYASDQGLSIEEAARNLRYQFLFETARQALAAAVAVGHTADDQVETVLMHLLRGSGLAGLRGMVYRAVNPAWDRSIPLVRPLLGVSHAETQAYCSAQGVHPLVDQSNFDLAYARNRLRHELIPLLETYNPQFRQLIWSSALTLGGDYQVVAQAVDQAWKKIAIQADALGVVFDRSMFLAELPGIQRGLLRKAIESLRLNLRDISLESIERGRAFIRAPSRSGQIDLVGKLYLKVLSGQIMLYPWRGKLPRPAGPALPSAEPIQLTVPGSIDLADGWRLEAVIKGLTEVTDRGGAILDAGPYEACLDLATLAAPLMVRCRRPGDRFHPLGLTAGEQKLSDFFINLKLEASARARWPLVCSDGKIVWVAGCRIGHPYRLTSASREILRLRLFRQLP